MTKWYAFHASTDDKEAAEIHLYDDIGMGGASAKDFIRELKGHAGKPLALRINSSGGSVVEGTAIYNALRRHKGGLTAYVDSLAASMASVIAMAADEVVMAENALMFVHNPWTIGMGDASDLRKEADTLDKIKANLARAYSRKSGMSVEEASALMDSDTWLDATEAVSMGLADRTDEPMEAAASVTREELRARFDNFANRMANKSTPAKVDIAEEAMNAELQAKVDELQAKVAAHEAEKAELAAASAQASEAVTAEIESLKAEVSRLNNEVATRDAEIAKLAAEQKTAGEQAAAIVAGLGVDPSAQAPEPPKETPAQIFAKLDGAEAVAFFRANKREIIATMTLS